MMLLKLQERLEVVRITLTAECLDDHLIVSVSKVVDDE